MKAPLFVRPFTDVERDRLEAGLHSADAFVLRRCQILFASARGERAPAIATALGCAEQTVRDVIHAFELAGIDSCLQRQSSRPKHLHTKLDPCMDERLRALLHTSPRTLGKPTSVWTLGLVAEVAFAEGLTAELVSDETIRTAVRRLGVRWKRAKQWITSPDPAYASKKGGATA